MIRTHDAAVCRLDAALRQRRVAVRALVREAPPLAAAVTPQYQVLACRVTAGSWGSCQWYLASLLLHAAVTPSGQHCRKRGTLRRKRPEHQ